MLHLYAKGNRNLMEGRKTRSVFQYLKVSSRRLLTSDNALDQLLYIKHALILVRSKHMVKEKRLKAVLSLGASIKTGKLSFLLTKKEQLK